MSDVAIGFVHPLMVNYHFMHSVINASRHEGNCEIISVMSGPNVSTARNLVVEKFLDDTDADWLFMCDTDMMFTGGAISRLIQFGEPVISGVYLTSGEKPKPCMYNRIAETGEQYVPVQEWKSGDLLEVDAVGAGCLLVHRDVYRDIREKIPNEAAPWFQEVQQGNKLVGEDFIFCQRAQACGFKVKVDTASHFGHIKGVLIGDASLWP